MITENDLTKKDHQSNPIDDLGKNLLLTINNFLCYPSETQNKYYNTYFADIIKCICFTEFSLASLMVYNIKTDTGKTVNQNMFPALVFSLGNTRFCDLITKFEVALFILQFKDTVKIIGVEDIGIFHKEHYSTLVDIFEALVMIKQFNDHMANKIISIVGPNANSFVKVLSSESHKIKLIEMIKKDVETFCNSYGKKEFYMSYTK